MGKLQKTKIALLCGASIFAMSLNVNAKAVKQNLADAGVINQERILYWLEKRGLIKANSTEVEKQIALDAYLSKAASQNSKNYPELAIRADRERIAAKKNKFAFSKAQSFASAAPTQTKVKVLGILIDFPDLPHNNNRLSRLDTNMFYDNYQQDHYRELLFSETGFSGPSGQNLLSAHQYFQQASGETFVFTGDVKGWYTAQQNAEYYGGNDTENDDNDKAVGELVKEAVTAAVAGMSTAELQSYDIEDPYDLDGDGNLKESDGIIDHIMLFHSSVGEEAGGGVLGQDAIWSHRFFVDPTANGYSIPGTSMKAYGYTVQPIDAAAGVCAHEFGHDLGLPDEYDTASSAGKGSPVGSWSIMSGGSWAGSIPGSQPTGFSPYARSYLQNKFGGNWVNEQVISLDSVVNTPRDVEINHAVDSSGLNQISIPLPLRAIPFKQPFNGRYQYYSGEGDLINNALSFDVNLPSSNNLVFSMKAHWDIETDFDYVQVQVDGVAISGNYTKGVNFTNNARNIITGKSADISTSTGSNNWVDLEFDLSAYAGRNVSISISYITDQGVAYYGFIADELKITASESTIYSNDAEEIDSLNLNGFIRTDDTKPGKESRYVIQLRSYQGLDAGLRGEGYVSGVLVWLEDFNESNNNVSEHAGSGLIGVVDADQHLISDLGTSSQVRDATFSLYDQPSFLAGLDDYLLNNSKFDDSQDYSSPNQRESGLKLAELGISIEVVSQSQDSRTATVRINKASSEVGNDELSASISTNVEFETVSFISNINGGSGEYRLEWDFGDENTSELVNPVHTYASTGSYTVRLTVTDAEGSSKVVTYLVTVYSTITASFTPVANELQVRFTNTSQGGKGNLRYEWNFGDGEMSSAHSPVHSYAQTGDYIVNLVVTDTDENTKTFTSTVSVTSTQTTDTTSETKSGGSSGGSLSFLSLLLLVGLRLRKR